MSENEKVKVVLPVSVDVLVDWRGHKKGDSVTLSTKAELDGAVILASQGVLTVPGVERKVKPEKQKSVDSLVKAQSEAEAVNPAVEAEAPSGPKAPRQRRPKA